MWTYKIWPGTLYIDNVWKKDKKESSIGNKKERQLIKGRWCWLIIIRHHICMEEQVETGFDKASVELCDKRVSEDIGWLWQS